MGFGGISIWQLIIILAIIVLLFGTKKLRNIGGDLGNAVKGFKKAVSEDNSETVKPEANTNNLNHKESEVKPNTTTPTKEQDKA